MLTSILNDEGDELFISEIEQRCKSLSGRFSFINERNIREIGAVLAYQLFIEIEIPRTLYEITNIFSITTKHFNEAYKKVFGSYLRPLSPEQFVPLYLTRLGYPEIEPQVTRVCKEVGGDMIGEGYKPSTIAIAAIIYCARNNGRKLKEGDVTRTSHVYVNQFNLKKCVNALTVLVEKQAS